ncbi:hypothetical protein QSH18_13120 [Xanthomonas sp. NCPPB 2654]|uniref:hypothetical protein n=1 Tax=unclassified Xanthomonas TaxID=2643310 RepID=UPI0021E002FB|nr:MULTISPECIES: hypothetical protein [unclassified Xanthomonas]MDL5366542.1 hypothetical protein [Xanthomonas sp. NCPPB 2654]UYC21313.1 hypothetical protein NUG20_03150 [Xanthomonas sp. CFBP 8443]
MGKHTRRRPIHAAPTGPWRRLGDRLRRPALLLAAALLVTTALLKLFLLVQAVSRGVLVTSGARGGPSRVYRLDADAGQYWFWIAWDGVFTVALLLLAGVFVWTLLPPRKRR